MSGDPRKLAGRYVINPLDGGEFYWHAFVGEVRVNGGLCTEYVTGVEHAKRAIAVARTELLKDSYYWDVETLSWVRKGELPAL